MNIKSSIDTTMLRSLNCRDVIRKLLGTPESSTHRFDRYYSPFRDDGRKPSLTVYEDGIKDFGGEGESWDAISFTMAYLDLGFSAACEYLSQDFANHQSRPKLKKQSRTASFPTQAWQIATLQKIAEYENILWESESILDYLRNNRGLSDKTIQQYRLGYNPKWDEYRSDGEVCKVAPGVVIPWFDNSSVIAVRIRTRTGALAVAANCDDSYLQNKYMSITGSRQSLGLFGATNFKAGQTVILAEGEFDAMLASQESDYVAVTRGSAGDNHKITESWKARLTTAKTIFGLLDNDVAGKKAGDTLLKEFNNFVPLPIPVGNDITEYLLEYNGTINALFANIDNVRIGANHRRALLRNTNVEKNSYTPIYSPPSLKPEITIRTAYISDFSSQIPQDGVVVLCSDKGTGKTTYGTQVVESYKSQNKSVMAITPFRSLTAATSTKYDLEHYESLTWMEWLKTAKLGITLKS
ncbi:MAG: hypothetical protein AAFR81_23950, partial [Chloroflexota bacterium]